MIKNIRIANLLLVLVFITGTIFQSFGNGQTERILDEKSFPVKTNAELVIDHEFGNLECANWDKDEISVTIIARVDSENEDKIQKGISRISYEVSGNSDRVSVRCRVNNRGKWNQNVSVDVKIMMPEDVVLDVNHKFGKGFIETANGPSKVHSEYGSMKIKALNSAESKMKVDFGEGKITHMAGGSMSISYSKIWVGTAGNLSLNMEYSNGEIEEADHLTVKQEGGDLKIESLAHIEGSSGFGSLKIGSLTKSLDIDSEYGSLTVRDISKDFSSIRVNNSFGSTKLIIDEDATYQLNAEAEFGSVDFPSSLANITYREKSINKTIYKGIIGNGQVAQSTVTVNSEYGSVKLIAE